MSAGERSANGKFNVCFAAWERQMRALVPMKAESSGPNDSADGPRGHIKYNEMCHNCIISTLNFYSFEINLLSPRILLKLFAKQCNFSDNAANNVCHPSPDLLRVVIY